MPSKHFPGDRTTLGTWVTAIGRALDAAGWDSAALLAEAGIDLKSLDGPMVRCPLTVSVRLWRIALDATGDPAFGIKAASYIKNTSFHALSYGISASSTLKEAFERAQRYCHVISDAVEYEFSRRGSEYHFIMEPTAEVPDESVDCLVAAYLRMCRSLCGREFSPLRIDMRRPRPSKLEDFAALLRAPLYFGAPQTRMIFDADGIERPLNAGNPELARHNDAMALQYLSRIDRQNIQVRVREILLQRLPSGEPSQNDVAELLTMSARTLQRKLGESGHSYKQILDETRRELAIAYLSASRYSIIDVTYLLGFSASSCFTRAFRRWTGQSPSDWREREVVLS
ncbi:MAG: AraC family transcriptional regulator [Steroidobacteraceae bacterium]